MSRRIRLLCGTATAILMLGFAVPSVHSMAASASNNQGGQGTAEPDIAFLVPNQSGSGTDTGPGGPTVNGDSQQRAGGAGQRGAPSAGVRPQVQSQTLRERLQLFAPAMRAAIVRALNAFGIHS